MQRTDYVWDTGAALPVILEEEINNDAGTPLVTFHYVYGLDLIARIEDEPGNPQAFYLHDGLGSVRTLTNASGTPNNTYDYDAFGALREQTGSSGQGFRFTGEQQDHEVASDLYYLRARYYDPAIGRFWSQDPLLGAPEDPQSLNPYLYVLNDPVNLIDSNGLHCRPWHHTHCVPDPVEEFFTETVPDAAATAGDAFVEGSQTLWDAAQYCSSHLWECYERFNIGAVGVGVTVFGFGITSGGCLVIAPIVGAATAVVGGVATCAAALTAGGIVMFGGGTMIYIAFDEWHDGTADPLSPEK